MKNRIIVGLLCVIFIVPLMFINKTYAFSNELLEFTYKDKIFTYSLAPNIKSSSVYDIDYKLKKHNRFGTKKDRQKLLRHILNLDFDYNIAIDYMFPNLSLTIDKIAKTISVKPQNAQISTKPNTEQVFFTRPEIVGVKLDTPLLIKNIAQAYLENKDLKFTLPTITLTPEILLKDFNHIHLRGDFATNISSSSLDRKHNIKNALNSLNKIEIQPNEIFSFNKAVGKRTESNGYRNAKIIVNNEFVDGIGGGVCQVSSTLYNSALLAGLEIVEANKHSKQVSYIKYGFDAMVNYGSSDLKFKNNTNEKITIITNYSPSKARIRIFGESLNQKRYKLINEIIKETQPIEEIVFDTQGLYTDKVIYEDEFFIQKKGCKGMEIKSYREYYNNNLLIDRKLLRHDIFPVQNTVKVYGTKKRMENTMHEILSPIEQC